LTEKSKDEDEAFNISTPPQTPSRSNFSSPSHSSVSSTPSISALLSNNRKHGLDIVSPIPVKKVSWGVKRAKTLQPILPETSNDIVPNINLPDPNTTRKQLVWQKLICNEILEDGSKKPRVMAAHAKSQTNRVIHPSPNVCDGISDAFNIPCADPNKSKGKV